MKSKNSRISEIIDVQLWSSVLGIGLVLFGIGRIVNLLFAQSRSVTLVEATNPLSLVLLIVGLSLLLFGVLVGRQ